MIDQEQRINKYLELEDNIKNLYDQPGTGKLLLSLFDSYFTPNDNYDVFCNMIGDTMLGFYKTTELPSLFQKELGLSADESQRLFGDLSPLLEPVVKREAAENESKKAEMAELTEKISQVKNTEIDNSEKEQVSPLRTMEGDINRIHGYGAYRSQQAEATQQNIAQQQNPTENTYRATEQNDLLSKKPAGQTESETRSAADYIMKLDAEQATQENKEESKGVSIKINPAD